MAGLDFLRGDIRSQDLKSNHSLTPLTPHLSWRLTSGGGGGGGGGGAEVSQHSLKSSGSCQWLLVAVNILHKVTADC